jgi:valyl-tRNA synthetase
MNHADLADRWIMSRFHSTAKEIVDGIDRYDINNISKVIYEFFWHDYCDWYLEMLKSRLYAGEPDEGHRCFRRGAPAAASTDAIRD